MAIGKIPISEFGCRKIDEADPVDESRYKYVRLSLR
jgi:hypothetical protein